MRLKDWNFEMPLPPTHGERVRSPMTRDVINFAYEASIKTQRDRVQVAHGLVDTWKFRKNDVPESTKTPPPSHTPCPTHLFHLAVSELYSFIINW